jgi:signal transduction histidine kinase
VTLRRTIAAIVIFGLVASAAILFGAWMGHVASTTAAERDIAMRLETMHRAMVGVGERTWESELRALKEIGRGQRKGSPLFSAYFHPGERPPGMKTEQRQTLETRLAAPWGTDFEAVGGTAGNDGVLYSLWLHYRNRDGVRFAAKVGNDIPAVRQALNRRTALLSDLFGVKVSGFLKSDRSLSQVRRAVRAHGAGPGPSSFMTSDGTFQRGDAIAMTVSSDFTGQLILTLADRAALWEESLPAGQLAGATGAGLGLIWGAAGMWVQGARRQAELARLQSNFVAAVSHELRTPLTAIRGAAEMLTLDMVPEHKRGIYYQSILTESDRLRRMVEQILDFDRMQRGQLQVIAQPTALATIAEQVVTAMQSVAAARDVILETNIAEPLTIHGDADTTAQALTNLLDNAIKFSPRGAEVRIIIEKRAGTAVLAVEDSGPGVPAGERQRIFDAFYRAGDETTRQTKGSGLGLYLVRRYVEASGGRITVTDAVGGGARFTMEWPCV